MNYTEGVWDKEDAALRAELDAARQQVAAWEAVKNRFINITPGPDGGGVEIPSTPEYVLSCIEEIQQEWDDAEKVLGEARQQVAEKTKRNVALRAVGCQLANCLEEMVATSPIGERIQIMLDRWDALLAAPAPELPPAEVPTSIGNTICPSCGQLRGLGDMHAWLRERVINHCDNTAISEQETIRRIRLEFDKVPSVSQQLADENRRLREALERIIDTSKYITHGPLWWNSVELQEARPPPSPRSATRLARASSTNRRSRD